MHDEKMNVEELQALLGGCSFSRNIACFTEIYSTNTHAKQLAAEGAVHGTVVLADRQTAGRGRLGKSFYSPTGGMYLSVILRLDLPLSDLMAVTACTACAVFDALRDFGITASIKWVNDLFLHDRKICGILTEGSFSQKSGEMEFLVVGIGLNLHPDAAMPPELAGIVTDLETETGLKLSRNDIAASILRHLERQIGELPKRMFLKTFSEHSYTLGKRVHVLQEGVEREGLAVAFAEDAGLIVRFPDGTEDVIRTGTAKLIGE